MMTLAQSLKRFVRRGAGLLVLGCSLGLSGCISVLPESVPEQIYRLNASQDLGTEALDDVRLILLERPVAPRALVANKIALSYPDGRIAYAAHSNWISPVPGLVQDLVMDAYAAQAPDIAAVRASDGVRSRWALRLDIRHFDAYFDQGENSAPLVRVMMRARIVDQRHRRLISSRTVEADVRASSRNVTSIVEAFDQASQAVTVDLVNWSRTTLHEQPERRSRAAADE